MKTTKATRGARTFIEPERMRNRWLRRCSDSAAPGDVGHVHRHGARSREDLTDTVGDINAVNSPGELTIDGFFTQLDEGNITLEVGKELSSRELLHDALSVSLTVELAGTLEVALDLLTAGLDPNFDPSVEGVSFTFLTGFADSRDVQ